MDAPGGEKINFISPFMPRFFAIAGVTLEMTGDYWLQRASLESLRQALFFVFILYRTAVQSGLL